MFVCVCVELWSDSISHFLQPLRKVMIHPGVMFHVSSRIWKRPFARGERCFLRALSLWVSIASNFKSLKTFKISAGQSQPKQECSWHAVHFGKNKSFMQKLLFAAILKTCSAKIAIKVVWWETLFYTTQKGNGLWRAISVYRVVTKSRALCAGGKWTWGSTWHLSHTGKRRI